MQRYILQRLDTSSVVYFKMLSFFWIEPFIFLAHTYMF